MLQAPITPPIYQIQGMVDGGSWPVVITMSMPPWDSTGAAEQQQTIIDGIAAMVHAIPDIILTTVQVWHEQAGTAVQWEPPTQP